ncbi:hypothetical protein CC80DRAFT_421929 [Byssothecium circinans]|uniref:Uncharacterized protein n=1 Tax=Byssothecium circinans TaxID=147558 RepID=A0A6A5TL61_9PLEO|nr:hypothetical protein CC80DRAFT_421929 [Byssothecium circinans]
MWTSNRAPSRPQRTPSVHSVASVYSNTSRPSSMISPQLARQPSRSGGYDSDLSSDTAAEDDVMPPMWQNQRQQSGSAVNRLSQKFGSSGPPPSAPLPLKPQQQQQRNSQQQQQQQSQPTHFGLGFTDSSATTLHGGDDYDFPEKTPTRHTYARGAPHSSHIPGPLESQLAALMSKIVFMEQKNPVISVTPDDYAEMSARLKQLETEKKQWQKRHEAIWALRDEDVENNIKIRGLLAKARRDLEAMTKLRDEDLVNVQTVRAKLAEATRQLDKQGGGAASTSNGRQSPVRARPGSMFMERRNTTDLFAAAQAAALQQRALELEKRNTDLVSQIETLKGGANIDDVNRVTAHQAWKGTVDKLEQKLKARDAEILRLRGGGAVINTAPSASHASSMSMSQGPGAGGVEFQRVEMLHEEHAAYREKMGGKLQALRSEKEALQRELHRKEDECHGLEVRVQSLQRRVGL